MSRKKTLAMTVLIGSGAAVFHGESVVARGPDSSGVYASDGKLNLPTGFRPGVFVGRC